jgi:hypothetical protein
VDHFDFSLVVRAYQAMASFSSLVTKKLPVQGYFGRVSILD